MFLPPRIANMFLCSESLLVIMVKTGLFVVMTAGIVWASMASLRHPGSHGFYRFFAWEAIALLFATNVDRWFTDPFSLRQIVSWILLVMSLLLVLEAVRLFKLVGRPQRNADESGDYTFEKTTRLVMVGIYRWIRHPMYSSLLLLAWAIFLKDPSVIAAIEAAAATGLLVATAKADEREDIMKFGDPYVEYMRRTRRFVPWVW
jgi:protein-S-isoprenylcysteine O-methyltransferase Ste14